MGSQTSTNIGDFQQSAGQVTSQLGLISAYFIAFIMIVISIALVYEAFQNTSITEVGSNQPCSNTDDCKNKGETCQDGQCNNPPAPKRKHLGFIAIALVLAIFAIFLVYYAMTVRNIAMSSRGGAQVIGTMNELELLKNV